MEDVYKIGYKKQIVMRGVIRMYSRKIHKGSLLLFFALFSLIITYTVAEVREWYDVTAGKIAGLREFKSFIETGDRLVWVKNSSDGIYYYGYSNQPTQKGYESMKNPTGFMVLDMGKVKTIDGMVFQNSFITTHLTEQIGAVAIYAADESSANFDPFSKDSYKTKLFRGVIQPLINVSGFIREKIEFEKTTGRYLLIEVLARNHHVGQIDDPDYKVHSVRFNDILVNETD